MNKVEDKNICAKCGGFCCKKCGCDYFVSDFDNLKLDYLLNVLSDGKISVVSSLDFKKTQNGKLICLPVLSLRARNENREVIDLLSFKTRCSQLGNNGCLYDLDNRPSGGATLIPGLNMACHSDVNRLEELNKWLPYQNVLGKIVKRYTGKSIDSKLREDVENLFYDILCHNFNGVLDIELYDVLNMLPLLEEVYPSELRNAKKRYNNIMTLKREKGLK